jgi:hypothetical protein
LFERCSYSRCCGGQAMLLYILNTSNRDGTDEYGLLMANMGSRECGLHA